MVKISQILGCGIVLSWFFASAGLAKGESLSVSDPVSIPYQIVPPATAPILPPNPEETPQPINSTNHIYLVIKLRERKVYVYQDDREIANYPIAIGKDGWETPTGNFQVMQMVTDPTWQHPLTGEIIPPGPDNPLGKRWIGFWTNGQEVIGFHGTPNEDSIGKAASHGCVRMFNRDVLSLYEKVTIGTPVIVKE